MSKFSPDHVDVKLGKSRIQITQYSIEKNPASRRLAVKMRCLQCVHYDDDPGGEDRIRNCTAYVCGLWSLRPYKNKNEGKRPAPNGRKFDPVQIAWDKPGSYPRGVRAYCWHCMGNGSAPDTRQMIHHCSMPACAIHPHRPYRSSTFSGATAQNLDGDSSEPDIEEADAENLAEIPS